MEAFKGVDEGALGLLCSVVAHRPKQTEEVRPHPRVALDVSRNVYATVDDVDALAKHADNRISLRVVAVTHNGLDVPKKLDTNDRNMTNASVVLFGSIPQATV